MSKKSAGVEAYVQTGDILAVVSALSLVIGKLDADASLETDTHIYKCGDTSLIIQPVQDGYLSVWLRGSACWPSSPALGRYLAHNLSCVVRCDPENEFADVSPYSDTFLQIVENEESLVSWS